MLYTVGMKAVNYRLPESTVALLNALAEKLGMTKTQVMILAIDRMAEKEKVK